MAISAICHTRDFMNAKYVGNPGIGRNAARSSRLIEETLLSSNKVLMKKDKQGSLILRHIFARYNQSWNA